MLVREKGIFPIATTKDWKQRKLLREQGCPRGRIPLGLSPKERMDKEVIDEARTHPLQNARYRGGAGVRINKGRPGLPAIYETGTKNPSIHFRSVY